MVHLTPSIEPLESRIAPAVIIAPGGHAAHYTDLDGDLVTIKVSKGRLSPADFQMSSDGAIVDGGEKLVVLDLSDDAGEFHRANLSITARPGPLGGDGFADVGFINAGGGHTDLGRVLVDGDLDRIDAGDLNISAKSPGLKLLVVQNLGSADDSHILGSIRVLRVLDDVSGGVWASHGIGKITINAGAVHLTIDPIAKTHGLSVNAPGTLTPGVGLVKTGTGSVVLVSDPFQTGGVSIQSATNNTTTGGTLQLGGNQNSYGGTITINNSNAAYNQVNALVFNTNISRFDSSLLTIRAVTASDGSLTLKPASPAQFIPVGATLTNPLPLTDSFLPLGPGTISAQLAQAGPSPTSTGGAVVSIGGSGNISGSTVDLTGAMVSGGTLRITGTNSGTNAAITTVGSSSTSLVKTGTGLLTLSGSNTFSGAVLNTSGVIRIVGTSESVNTSNVTLANPANGTLTVVNGGTVITDGATSNLVKTGTGTLTLAGPNAFTGTTTINAGTLQIGTGAVLQGGGLVINGGNVQIGDGVTATSSNITITGFGTVPTGTLPAGATLPELNDANAEALHATIGALTQSQLNVIKTILGGAYTRNGTAAADFDAFWNKATQPAAAV